MDVVSPRAREVEQAIASARFSAALPIALELRQAHPDEPLVELWLAAIYRGLDRHHDEAASWERFIALGSAPAEACPGLADAYARADATRAVAAYQRCVDLDPRDPERLIDLAMALERAGRGQEAVEAWHRAGRLDPKHPAVARRLEHLTRAATGRLP
jgi:tetratricopeptide (TPR) repeat protein